jgi:mannosyltransferase OCH1-like enzyme
VLHRLKQLLAPIRYWKELPLRPLGDRPATTTPLASKIPPTVIQTWEDRLFGKNHLKEMAKFRDLNPELSFELWDRDQRESYLRER